MEKLRLERPWKEVKELMIEIVPELANEDLEYVEGKEDQLIEKIAKKINRGPEDTKGWIESVSHTTDRAS